MPSCKCRIHVLFRSAGIKLYFLAAIVFVLIVGCSNGPASVLTVTSTAEVISTAVIEPTEQAVDDLLASIERSMELIRGIDTPPPVEHKFVDKAGMRERLDEELSDPEVLGQIDHESTLFKLLGVIPQDANLNDIYDSMLGSQVLGLYDPEKEEFFVLGDDQSGAESIDIEAQLTYAHEYVHRLQDAKFDLEKMKKMATGDDMSLAISALIEGDATSAQSQYMFAHYDFSELSELLESAIADQAELTESPYFLQRSLEFSYINGAAFIAVILQLGQFTAVDAVFVDPPKSTEQVLHPEKYIDQEIPIKIDITDDAMGGDWTVQAENVMGEFFIRTWLESLGSENAIAAAAGWGGDAYAVFESELGDTALGLGIAWDTENDAREFIVELSNSFNTNIEYSSTSNRLDGVLEAWQGPGGYIVINRWSDDEGRFMTGISVATESELSHKLNFSLAVE